MNQDLVDVLTPTVVRPGDFVNSLHVTTLVVIVPGDCEQDWLEKYERLEQFVVPKSGKKFEQCTDKDGTAVWRVVMFRSAVEGFKAACKSTRFVVREFDFSEETYSATLQRRSSLEAECRRQDDQLNKMSRYAWSDVFAAWVHVKTMRTFVESVLRFGMDSQSNAPNFAAFIVKPASSSSACAKELRKVLHDVFVSKGIFGHSFISDGSDKGKSQVEAGGPENALLGEVGEYYPYVSITLSPLLEKKSH